MHFAFIFDSVGGTEWLVLLGVILIVVGPKNLPSAARTLGSVMSKLRRAADEFKRQLLTMDEEFKKGVEAAVSDDDAGTSSSSSSTPAESGTDAAETDAAETDAASSGYDDESPYPGHDFYDETQYQNASGADADAPSGDAPAASAEAEAAAAPVPPKADPYAVKITVSTASSAGK